LFYHIKKIEIQTAAALKYSQFFTAPKLSKDLIFDPLISPPNCYSCKKN
jgi:hypothetical protein